MGWLVVCFLTPTPKRALTGFFLEKDPVSFLIASDCSVAELILASGIAVCGSWQSRWRG